MRHSPRGGICRRGFAEGRGPGAAAAGGSVTDCTVHLIRAAMRFPEMIKAVLERGLAAELTDPPVELFGLGVDRTPGSANAR